MDVNNLEDALNKAKTPEEGTSNEQPANPQLSGEEEIGFHKGALNTLAAERNELVKMVDNVEAIMQAHLKRLQELGVKIETQTPQIQEGKK